jgi:hypothetical protein
VRKCILIREFPGLKRFVVAGGDFRIHRIRRQVDLARPRDGAIVDNHLLEKPFIQQRSERTRKVFLAQLNVAGESVFEPDKKAVASLRFYFNDVPIHTFLD